MIEIKRILNNRVINFSVLVMIVISVVYSGSFLINDEMYAYKAEFTQYEKTKNVEEITNLYLLTEVDYYSNFDDNLASIVKNNESKLKSSLFASEKNQKMINKENQLLNRLKAKDFEFKQSFVTNKLLGSNIYNMLVLVFSFILILVVFNQDIEADILRLFASTRDSMSKLFTRKILSLIVFILVFTLLLGSVMMFTILFSGESLFSPIHSLSNYFNYPYIVSIIGFIAIRLLNIFLLGLIVSLMLLLILIITKNFILSASIFLLFMLFEYIFYSFIPITSSFVILKYINLYALLTNGLQQALIYIFNQVIYANTLNTLVLMSLILLMLALGYYLYQSIYNRGKLKSLVTTKFKSKSLFSQQFYQINYIFKGVLIIILVFFYSMYKYVDYEVISPDWKSDFEIVQKQYLGNVNEKTLTDLQLRIDEATVARQKEIECLENLCDEEKIIEYNVLSKDLWIYEMIYEDVSDIVNRGNDYYINKDGLSLLYDYEYNFSMRINFIIIISSSLLIMYIHAFGIKQKKITKLLDSTKYGNKKMYNSNLMHYNLITLLIFMMVSILYVMKLSKIYNLFAINFDMQNIIPISYSISNYTYLLISIFIQVLFYSAVVNSSNYILRKYGLLKSIVFSIGVIVLLLTLSLIAFDVSPLMLFTTTLLSNLKISIIYIISIITINIIIVMKTYKLKGGVQ